MTRRIGQDHDHPDYWRRDAQYRYEDRMANELRELNAAIDRLTTRITLIMGGVIVISFVLSLAVPFLRSALGITAS